MNQYVSAYRQRDNVVMVYRDEHGNRQFEEYPAEDVGFFHTVDLTPQMLLDKRVKSHKANAHGWTRVVFYSGYWDAERLNKWTGKKGVWVAYRENIINEWGISSFEADVSPIKRLMVEGDFKIAKPKLAYLDIETDSRKTIEQAINGEARVLCWSIVSETGEVWSDVLEEDHNEDEARLLVALWNRIDDFDLIAGWNLSYFDEPVIRARSKLFDVQTLRHTQFLDHLLCFKRCNIVSSDSGDEKRSFSLNTIARAVLKESKHDLDASRSWEYWEAGGKDREDLVNYCIQDTDLCRRIEERTGYIELSHNVCSISGIFLNTRTLKPTQFVDAYMLRLGFQRGTHFSSKFYSAERVHAEKYEGAYVLKPRFVGITQNVHVADFASMYPSVMRSFNLSPDAKDENGTCTSPANGVKTRTDIEGLLCCALRELMAARGYWKKKKSQCTPGSKEEKECERITNGYKTAINSFYGVQGSIDSRFFDRDLSEATTGNAVWLIKATIQAAEERGYFVGYSDTDALNVTGCNEEEFREFIDWCNTVLYPRMLEECGARENVVKLDSDKFFEHIVFTAAKKYVGKQKDNPNPVVKGLEMKRGDVSRLACQMQEEVVKLIVAGQFNVTPYELLVAKHREQIATMDLPLDLVQVTKGINELDDYKVNAPQVRVAQIMRERGEETRAGTKVSWVVADGYCSPKKVIPASDYTGVEADRMFLWDSQVYPPTLRLLEAAFPKTDWKRWSNGGRKPKVKILPGQLSLL